MHDWSLIQIHLAWGTGELSIDLIDTSERARTLSASSVSVLEIPRTMPWGPSASINRIEGPDPQGDGTSRVRIHVQSGDSIVIVARAFELPR